MLEARLGPALLLHHWGKIDALTDTEQEELYQIEKFAELLIRECAQFTDYGIRKFILNHFEIKE